MHTTDDHLVSVMNILDMECVLSCGMQVSLEYAGH